MDIEVVVRELKKDIWPHKVTIKTSDSGNIGIWLDETMGIYKGRWNFIVRYTGVDVDFYFKDGKDATLFSLRWV